MNFTSLLILAFYYVTPLCFCDGKASILFFLTENAAGGGGGGGRGGGGGGGEESVQAGLSDIWAPKTQQKQFPLHTLNKAQAKKQMHLHLLSQPSQVQIHSVPPKGHSVGAKTTSPLFSKRKKRPTPARTRTQPHSSTTKEMKIDSQVPTQ